MPRQREKSNPAYRIRTFDIKIVDTGEVVMNGGGWTEYEGTQEDLLAVRLATVGMFKVGKSGTRSHCGDNYPLQERFHLKRCSNGRWRLRRDHEAGKPPYLPFGTIYAEVLGKIRSHDPNHVQRVRLVRLYPDDKICARIEPVLEWDLQCMTLEELSQCIVD